MKKAVCISCTNHYTERTAFIENFLLSKKYECIYITSNFDHTSKSFYKLDRPNTIQIPTKPYRKNLSFSRIYSHIKFSHDAIKKVKEINPDLLYVEIPPNSLSRQAAKYKRKNPRIKLIFDIFDMWPETFPNKKMKFLLKIPFGLWGWFRNSGLNFADTILTECRLFTDKINGYIKNKKSKVLYLCREDDLQQPAECDFDDQVLHLCYLGSINNIIDIPTITQLLKNINSYKKTILHIIGDGESREQFISSVKETGTQVLFHGKLYDQDKKQEIFNKCSFGLNIMKESVYIGLTMKSVDYLLGGLPIINSIGADTWDLVSRENIGVNIDRENLSTTAKIICDTSKESLISLKLKTQEIFKKYFSTEAFFHSLEENLS